MIYIYIKYIIFIYLYSVCSEGSSFSFENKGTVGAGRGPGSTLPIADCSFFQVSAPMSPPPGGLL